MPAETAVYPSVKPTAAKSVPTVPATASHSEAASHLLSLLRCEHIVSGKNEVHSRVRKVRSQRVYFCMQRQDFLLVYFGFAQKIE